MIRDHKSVVWILPKKCTLRAVCQSLSQIKQNYTEKLTKGRLEARLLDEWSYNSIHKQWAKIKL